MATEGCQTVAEYVEDILSMEKTALEEILECYNITANPSYPHPYISSLSGKDLTTALRTVAIAFHTTNGREIPREHQLRFVVKSINHDSALIAGTGSGKTLAVALLVHLASRYRITITISPLKRLQITHARDFLEKYKIPTLVVNEDTPRGVDYWKENVWDSYAKRVGPYRHLIVTTEQLFKMKHGHFSRLGLLLQGQPFRRVIARFCIDEAHFVLFAGLPRFSLPAFRPTWGRLNEIKILFPNTPFNVMTATSPPQVLRAIENAVLNKDYHTIRHSCNRPNLIYATHCVVNSLEDLNNYSFILTQPFELKKQKRVLIFFDRISLLRKVLHYLRSLLPDDVDKQKIVQFYDSCMSAQYLTQVHADFTTPGGACRVLLATTSESTGIDFPDVDIVINVNIPPTGADALQRGGRANRQLMKFGLFLILYERWVLEVDLDEFEENRAAFGDDQDRPREKLTDKSDVRERAASSMVRLLSDDQLCMRKFFRDYLGDESPNSLKYSGPFCCNRHDDDFVLNDFLPSPVFGPSAKLVEMCVDDDSEEGPTRNHYRLPLSTRYELQLKLWCWRLQMHEGDELKAVRTPDMILSDHQLADLSKALPNKVASAELIQTFLGEGDDWTDEWAAKICAVIKAFDEALNALDSRSSKRRRVKT
ncbi:hypothetical protein V5O48_018553 [Marasmius crinis-equi]|uniref:DNA 3'-5' helicase n=1 Tax=Marasmius crinis-equi TaxID=585013 RepID=A0ABR3EKU9_9AGAR